MAGTHHRTYRYRIAAKAICLTATANPNAVCWRDGLTLGEHQARWPGSCLRWTAGHTRAGSESWTPWLRVTERPPTGDWLAPEISRCNYANHRRPANPTSRRW
jgi:hypothetical protein